MDVNINYDSVYAMNVVVVGSKVCRLLHQADDEQLAGSAFFKKIKSQAVGGIPKLAGISTNYSFVMGQFLIKAQTSWMLPLDT